MQLYLIWFNAVMKLKDAQTFVAVIPFAVVIWNQKIGTMFTFKAKKVLMIHHFVMIVLKQIYVRDASFIFVMPTKIHLNALNATLSYAKPATWKIKKEVEMEGKYESIGGVVTINMVNAI